MAFTDINREDRLVQKTVAEHLEKKLAQNALRLDYYGRYSAIIADYNRDEDRVLIEETFAKLLDLVNALDAESRRAAEEGLTEDEYTLFCLFQGDYLSGADREKVKLSSKGLFETLSALMAARENWTEKEQTQAEVEVLILDHVFSALPTPPFIEYEIQAAAKRVYEHVWQRSTSGCYGFGG